MFKLCTVVVLPITASALRSGGFQGTRVQISTSPAILQSKCYRFGAVYFVNNFICRIIKFKSMKLQCNVCHESPIVDVVQEPNHTNDLVCCPSCDKQLAYATEKKYSNKLVWKALDTEFNKDFGKAPVKVISL